MKLENDKEYCEHENLIENYKKHLLPEDTLFDICNLLKILGEPSRIKIVLALAEGEMCVYHIVKAVGSNQSAVSHQLRILRENKVIKARREGQNIIYSLDDEHIMQIVNLVKIHVQEEEENGK